MWNLPDGKAAEVLIEAHVQQLRSKSRQTNIAPESCSVQHTSFEVAGRLTAAIFAVEKRRPTTRKAGRLNRAFPSATSSHCLPSNKDFASRLKRNYVKHALILREYTANNQCNQWTGVPALSHEPACGAKPLRSTLCAQQAAACNAEPKQLDALKVLLFACSVAYLYARMAASHE